MKLSVMFLITAALTILIGLVNLVAPTVLSQGTLTASSPGFLFMAVRFWGVAYIGLGLIAWLVRDAESSKARDGVTMGFFIFFLLHGLTSLYGQFADPSVSGHWLMALLQLLIAAGFFLAGRSSMSTSKR